MNIKIVGAGPAGLYFAALMKKHDPRHRIDIFERNFRDATWGFGVVFSDRALGFLQSDDEALYEYLMPHLETWSEIAIAHNDTRIDIPGNGFSSIGRLELLTLLYGYVERLGVNIHFNTNITNLAQLGEADLIVGANGAFSWIRSENEEKFGTTVDWRPNRFIWYGTSKAFNSLTLTFRETDVGVFCAHHYRYKPDMSTFLVEVEEGTWGRAGFETMAPEETIRYCERVFTNDLDGYPIISNNSYWRKFPAVWNERWSFENVVLIGDALRTAHFSIGSGTRLAMEDAIALFKAFRECGPDLKRSFSRFQEIRLPAVKKIWDAANVSIRWYEDMNRLVSTLTPVELAYDYMTRTGRIDHAEIRRCDPRLAAAYEALHPEVIQG